MGFKLYDFPMSPNGRKVRALALELGIALDVVPVDLMTGAHKAPEYLKKNPNGKVPVFEDNGWFLWESAAIMQYLADQKPEKGLYPTEPRLRAEINKWLIWDSTHMAFEALFPLYFERMFGPMMKAPPRPEFEKRALEQFNRFAAVVNGALEGKQYLVGNKFTIADFAIMGTFMFRDNAKIDMSACPHLKAYLERLEPRDSWQKTAPPKMG